MSIDRPLTSCPSAIAHFIHGIHATLSPKHNNDLQQDIMGRMTRAKAAEVAERMHIDEDAVLDMSNIEEKVNPTTPEPTERAVLGNIAPNSAEGKGSDLVGRKTRSKKKDNVAADTKTESKAEEHEEKSADEQTEEDALDATTNETMERLAKLRITSFGNQQPSDTSQSQENSVPAALPDVAEATVGESHDVEATEATMPATPAERESTNELPSISIATQSELQEDENSEHYGQDAPEPPSSPIATAVPKVIKSLRKDTPSKRSTSNKENVEPVEPLEQVVQVEPIEQEQEHIVEAVDSPSLPDAQQSSPSQAQSADAADVEPTSSSSPKQCSRGKSEDSIEALDNMDEAVEKVNLGIANANSPEKKQSPKPSDEKGRPKKSKPAPVVRLTKAAAARLSMAQTANKETGNSSTTARPRPSTMLGRTNGVRQSIAPAATNKPSPKPKKETVIPHSKPRPISLSFPTPPPAARSSKAPTKSSFQLPGEAVAAKLKAAREERMKREAAAATSKANAKAALDEKKPAFKARPVPSTLKKTPSVRHTAASRARESIMTGDAAPKPATAASTTGLKRSNTVPSSRPRPSTVPATAAKPSRPAQLTVQKRARPSSVHVPASGTIAPRQISSSSARQSTAPAARSTSATSKGKEVYARFSAARNAAENEKREKEDAARKARAAAAERGRAASREWAEKQKVRKMIAKVEGDVAKA